MDKRKMELKLQEKEMKEEDNNKKRKKAEEELGITLTVLMRCEHVGDDDWKYVQTIIEFEEIPITDAAARLIL